MRGGPPANSRNRAGQAVAEKITASHTSVHFIIEIMETLSLSYGSKKKGGLSFPQIAGSCASAPLAKQSSRAALKASKKGEDL